jgi:hypothetical protein
MVTFNVQATSTRWRLPWRATPSPFLEVRIGAIFENARVPIAHVSISITPADTGVVGAAWRSAATGLRLRPIENDADTTTTVSRARPMTGVEVEVAEAARHQSSGQHVRLDWTSEHLPRKPPDIGGDF